MQFLVEMYGRVIFYQTKPPPQIIFKHITVLSMKVIEVCEIINPFNTVRTILSFRPTYQVLSHGTVFIFVALVKRSSVQLI